MENVRRWHGDVYERFTNIDSLVNRISERRTEWTVPPDMLEEVTDCRNRLLELIGRCRCGDASRYDRRQCNLLLKSTVSLCMLQVRLWAYSGLTTGVLTRDDVHLLGFLLPDERVCSRETCKVKADVRVTVLDGETVCVEIVHADENNPALALHGWPGGVRSALIVIHTAVGDTEVFRQITTQLRNEIRMPKSHGRQFVVKASFLRHVSDTPLFGNQLAFSIPLRTIAANDTSGQRRQNDFNMPWRNRERFRRDTDKMKAYNGPDLKV